MQFDLPKEKTSIIKVIGVGGGGSNAVNYMYQQGIQGVNFVVCNTDAQALDLSPVPNKIQLGPSLTEGRGAGSKPEIGQQAMEESIEDISEVLEVNTKMVFITAGMGGGTGTGGAPILARKCRDMGILTVGIVTIPFGIEGRSRKSHAMKGIEEMRSAVDTLIIISNDKLREVYGNLKLSQAFAQADDILTTAAKGIAEIITVPGYVNVDFEDVKTVMTNSGVAIMGSATAEGEHRALKAVEAALSSPLLNDSDIAGAKHILMNITSGSDEVQMDEMAEILEYVQEQAGEGTDVIWGTCTNEGLQDKLSVTIIATGFETNQIQKKQNQKKPTVVYPLDNKINTEETASVESNSAANEEENYSPTLKSQDSPVADETVDNEEAAVSFSFSDDAADKDSATFFELDEAPALDNRREEVSEDADASFQFTTYTADNISDEVAEEEHLPTQPSPAAIDKQTQDRRERLRRFNYPFSKRSIEEMEEVPAYKRRGLDLNDVTHSSDNNLSRLSLQDRSDEQTDRWELRDNNSFLHDSVD